MSRKLMIGAAAAALLAAGAPAPANAAETAMNNPLLPKWTGPLRRRAAVRQGEGRALQARARGGDGRAARRRSTPSPTTPRRPPSRTRSPRWRRAGARFDRVRTSTASTAATMSTPEFQAVEREMAPKLAAFADKITQNEKLFRASRRSTTRREKAKLTPEQQRLAWLALHELRARRREARRRGQEAARPRSTSAWPRSTRPSARTCSPTRRTTCSSSTRRRTSPACPTRCAPARRGRRRVARPQGQVGDHRTRAPRSSRSSPTPTARDLREKVWRTFVNRGDNGDAHDNNKIITEILKLRAERAKLLGYATHAHWRLENAMAKTPERAMELMEAVWTPAVARVREEVADMQAIADKEGAKITIEPWDYRYYAEKVRKAKYDLDQNEVKPYLQLEKLREGMFWVAGELFGFNFTPVDGRARLPPRRPRLGGDGRGRASTSASGTSTPTRAPASSPGAWMNAYRTQERFDGDDHDHRLQQLELREGQAGRAGADQLGRRADALPRVRPRAARPQLRT